MLRMQFKGRSRRTCGYSIHLALWIATTIDDMLWSLKLLMEVERTVWWDNQDHGRFSFALDCIPTLGCSRWRSSAAIATDRRSFLRGNCRFRPRLIEFHFCGCSFQIWKQRSSLLPATYWAAAIESALLPATNHIIEKGPIILPISVLPPPTRLRWPFQFRYTMKPPPAMAQSRPLSQWPNIVALSFSDSALIDN